MKITLINPLIAPTRKPYCYNLGLGYIGSSLQQAGHEVELLDIEGFRYPRSKVINILKGSKCDAIGIGTIITGYKYVKWLVKQIRRLMPQVSIWVGNSIASTIPEILLKDIPEVDIAVIGEAEITAKELAKVIENKGDLSSVNGICYRKNGQIIRTPERALIEDLDSIPFPAWALFPQEKYMQHNKGASVPQPTAFISSTRGCPYHCTYCYHPFQNKKIRYHSAKRIVDEIKILTEKYHIKSFQFTDDLFIINKKRVIEFCDILEKENIKLKWQAAARVNLVDEELLRRMKKAGCVALGFGVESASPIILKNIKKQATVNQAIKAVQLCKKIGIYPSCSFMIGNIGETRETIRKTVAFILNYLDSPVSFFIPTPYPETELYEYAIKNGKIVDPVTLFMSYGEQSQKLLVNFTNLSDRELLSLKNEMEGLIVNYLNIKHPYKRIKTILGQFKILVIKILKSKGNMENALKSIKTSIFMLRKKFRF